MTSRVYSVFLVVLAITCFLGVESVPAPAPFLVPTGIKLPDNLLNQVIPTSNPYVPNRPEYLPPSPSASPTSTSKSYFTFIVRDFIIILAGTLGFLVLAIAILMIWKYVKGDDDLVKQWEAEQDKAIQRTNEALAKKKAASKGLPKAPTKTRAEMEEQKFKESFQTD